MRNSIRGEILLFFPNDGFLRCEKVDFTKSSSQMNVLSLQERKKMSNSFQSIGAFFLRVFRISNNLPMSGSLFFFTTVNFYPWDHCFYMAWAIRLVIRNQND